MTWRRAVVIGANGGIGSALAKGLETQGAAVVRLARSEAGDRHIDLTDEGSIAAAADSVGAGGSCDLVIVATGMLHAPGIQPEKTWRQLAPDALAQQFAVNAIGPALVAKHFLPLLSEDRRAGFAALSARVGSIADNRLGGWYGYRASKAALNMLVRSLSIELARSRPQAFCVALHPGTVDTRLSAPFQRNVPAGQLFDPTTSATALLDVLDRCDARTTGRILAWDGTEIAP